MFVIKELFINVCIFVTVIFIENQIYQITGLGVSAPKKVQYLSGVINGILGVILMIFSIQVVPGVLLDFRQLVIMVAAVYLGWRSAFLTGCIIAIFRLLDLGITQISVIAFIGIMSITLACVLISFLIEKKDKQWIYMLLCSGIIFTVFLKIQVKDDTVFRQTLLFYWVSVIFAGIIVFYLVEYIVKSNMTINRLREEATIDYLTGLQNVRSFDKSFNFLLGKTRENNETISLLALDIDFFKKINDTYGHSAGDSVLKELGFIILKSVRDFDVVARVGGEEFAIILRDCPNRHSYEIAERVRTCVEKNRFRLPGGESIQITISIGVAVYPGTVAELEMLKEKADEKLYEAKRTGRNKVCI